MHTRSKGQKSGTITEVGDAMKHQNTLLWQLPLLILVGTLLLCTTSDTPAQTVPQIAQKALAATVSLQMQDRNGVPLGQGSGFFVQPNLIATNYHVIEGATQGTAKLVGKDTTYLIEGITATDKTNDLALLKVTVQGIKPLPLSDSDTVQIGETVYVAGNPLGFEGTVSDGIISGRRDRNIAERLQMTAPISPGSSGGPVLNSDGTVIGVSVSIYRGIEAQNLNFAIPSNYLKALLERSGPVKPLSESGQSISAETYFIRGYEKAELGDYQGAIADFTHAIRLQPDVANAYYNRGNAKAGLGQHHAAIADFDTAIRLKPDNAKAYYNRGVTKADLGQYVAAIADYNTAIRLKPDFTNAYYNRGIARSILGEHFDAIADYDTAIRLKPDFASAYYNRGNTKARLGQYPAAIVDYDILIRFKPDDPDAYYNRGIAKASLRQYLPAIVDFNIAIHLKPDFASAYVNRGITKSGLGQYSAAIVDYNTAIRLKPDDANAYYNRGIAKSELDQHVAAISDYDIVIRLRPNYADAYLNRGITKALLKRFQEATQDLRVGFKLAEQSGDENLKARIEKALQIIDE